MLTSGYTTRIAEIKPRRRVSRLRLTYEVPDPFDTLEAYRRFHHLDLDTMDREALQRERARMRAVVLLSDRPHPWYLERLAQVEARFPPTGWSPSRRSAR